ncbi:MAG: tRNA (guanosine(46)-N7)-methyltransferase TrmB [Planctomycetaceae bacterium]|nr:tRNA (guanosine(46)-N7)-methyltransferase TrmB [Planctomycetaceae bacterium]
MQADLPAHPLLLRPGRELPGPGAWEGVFGRRAPLEVEVGFGRDDALLRRAKARPERDFLGLELKRDRVETYLSRAARLGIRNLRILPGRAEVVFGVMLPAASVAAARILFPDPWPKDKHAWNRLLQPFFARELRRTLEPGADLLLATDDAAYAAQMRSVMDGDGGFEGGPADERTVFDGTTIFERKGLAEGRKGNWFLYRRRASAAAGALPVR